MAVANADVRERLVGYATLVRVPNLFTAPPDVVAGAALAVAAGGTVSPSRLLVGCLGSVLLYAGGTTLNDYFDAAVDERERPERPIPSGVVSRTEALAFGVVLLGGGVALAGIAGGLVAGVAVALAVLAYDGWLKGGLTGSVAMGATRGLNVLLGVAIGGVSLSTLFDGSSVQSLPVLAVVPIVIAGYIATVTAMANGETTGGSRHSVVTVAVVSVLAVLAVPSVLQTAGVPEPRVLVGSGLAIGVLFWVGPALYRAAVAPVPESIGFAVGTCVLGEVVLAGAFAAVAGPLWAIGSVCWFLPAAGFARVFNVS